MGGGIETGSEYLVNFVQERHKFVISMCNMSSLAKFVKYIDYPCTPFIYHKYTVSSEFRRSEGCALYIDTEGTFRPKRVAQMAEGFGMDANDLLDNILFAGAYSSDHQMKLLQEAASMILNHIILYLSYDDRIFV